MAITITGLLGCGGDAEYRDAGSGDDGIDPAGVHDAAGAGTVEVLALGFYPDHGTPQAGLPVLFHDAAGTLVARVLTGADGRARAEVTAGGMVTVIDEEAARLTTILGTAAPG